MANCEKSWRIAGNRMGEKFWLQDGDKDARFPTQFAARHVSDRMNRTATGAAYVPICDSAPVSGTVIINGHASPATMDADGVIYSGPQQSEQSWTPDDCPHLEDGCCIECAEQQRVADGRAV